MSTSEHSNRNWTSDDEPIVPRQASVLQGRITVACGWTHQSLSLGDAVIALRTL